jgi:hypothetical protein
MWHKHTLAFGNFKLQDTATIQDFGSLSRAWHQGEALLFLVDDSVLGAIDANRLSVRIDLIFGVFYQGDGF